MQTEVGEFDDDTIFCGEWIQKKKKKRTVTINQNRWKDIERRLAVAVFTYGTKPNGNLLLTFSFFVSFLSPFFRLFFFFIFGTAHIFVWLIHLFICTAHTWKSVPMCIYIYFFFVNRLVYHAQDRNINANHRIFSGSGFSIQAGIFAIKYTLFLYIFCFLCLLCLLYWIVLKWYLVFVCFYRMLLLIYLKIVILECPNKRFIYLTSID